MKRQKTSEGPSEFARYTKNGFRWVEPYEYEFKAFAKERWVGKKLIDVCVNEFVAFDAAYYSEAISTGIITINGLPTRADHVFKHNDVLRHLSRCVENPVSGEEISTLFENDELLIVSKPASIPVHACGGYRVNTLVALLDNTVHPCHRIDRLTSGIVILGKHSSATRKVTQALVNKTCEKVYLARVRGSLPQPVTVTGWIACTDKRIGKFVLLNGRASRMHEEHTDNTHPSKTDSTHPKAHTNNTHINTDSGHIDKTHTDSPPTHTKAHTDRSNTPTDSPQTDNTRCSNTCTKFSDTRFTQIADFPNGESLIECRPTTGRTHQIRLHLQFLKIPIVNDICYGGEFDSNHPFAIRQIPSLQYDNIGKDFCGGIFLHAHRYVLPELGIDVTAPPPAWAARTHD